MNTQTSYYRQLPQWPVLPAATRIIGRPDNYRGHTLRIPSPVIAAAGLSIEAGIRIMQHGDRILLTAGVPNAPLAVDRNRIVVSRKALNKEMGEGNYSLVCGPGYIVITTPADAAKLGGRAVVETTAMRNSEPVKLPAQRGTVVQLKDQPASGSKGPSVRLSYPALQEWPKLGDAVAIHANVGLPSLTAFRIPLRIMKEAGLDVRRGVNVATYCGRALIWTSPYGGMYGLESANLQFVLAEGVLSAGVTRHNFSLVRGPGYLVVTSLEDAQNLAPSAPVLEYEKMDKHEAGDVFESRQTFSLKPEEILAWMDEPTRTPTCNNYAITGPIWEVASLTVGENVRFFRYSNCLHIERTQGPGHATLNNRGIKSPYPRMYVGPLLFQPNSKMLRIVATTRGMILCEADSDVGRLCQPSMEIPKNPSELKRFIARHPAAQRSPGALQDSRQRFPANVEGQITTLGKFAVETIGENRVRGESNTSVYPMSRSNARIQVNGLWLREYGFVPGARYSITPHPLQPARRLVTLDAEGPYAVTTCSGETPKLYIPLKHLQDFNSTHVKIFGTFEGLHVQRVVEKRKPMKKAA